LVRKHVGERVVAIRRGNRLARGGVEGDGGDAVADGRGAVNWTELVSGQQKRGKTQKDLQLPRKVTYAVSPPAENLRSMGA